MAFDWVQESQRLGVQQEQEEGLQQQQPLEEQFAPVQRGTFGDIASRFARGGVSAVELAGEGLEVAGIKTPLSGLAQESRRKFDFLKPDIDEFIGKEGFISRGIKGGIESILPSVAGGVPGAVAGAAVGSVVPGVGTAVGGTVGAILGMVGLFGLGTYGQTKKEALARGLSEDEAHDVAFNAGTIEAGGEAIATGVGLFSFGLGKALKMPMKSVLKTMIKTSPKQLLKSGLVTAGGELGTEVPQAVLGAMNREAAGLPTASPTEAGFEAIIPALTMSFLFSSGAGIYNNTQQDRLLRAINSDNARERNGARGLISKNLRNQDPAFSDAWNAVVKQANDTETPVDVSGDFVQLGNQIKEGERESAAGGITMAQLQEDAVEMNTAVNSGVSPEQAVQDLFDKKVVREKERVESDKEAAVFSGKALSRLKTLNKREDEVTREIDRLMAIDETAEADKLRLDREVVREKKRAESDREAAVFSGKVLSELQTKNKRAEAFGGNARLALAAMDSPENAEALRKLQAKIQSDKEEEGISAKEAAIFAGKAISALKTGNKRAEAFGGRAKLSLFALNSPENTEIIQRMQELNDSTTVTETDKGAAIELLAKTAEATAAASKPITQERAVELADKVILGTATPQDLKEINFEKQREDFEAEQAKLKEAVTSQAASRKEPGAPTTKATTPTTTSTRIEELEGKIGKGEELTREELAEFGRLKFPDVTEEQRAQDKAIVEEAAAPVELAERTEGDLQIEREDKEAVRKTGNITWKETAPGIFEGKAPKTQKDLTLVKERADKKSPYSVIIDGQTLASGVSLDRAKGLAEEAIQDTEWKKGKDQGGNTTESLSGYVVTNHGKNKVELRKDGLLVQGGDKSKFKFSSVRKAKQVAEGQLGFTGGEITKGVKTRPVVKEVETRLVRGRQVKVSPEKVKKPEATRKGPTTEVPPVKVFTKEEVAEEEKRRGSVRTKKQPEVTIDSLGLQSAYEAVEPHIRKAAISVFKKGMSLGKYLSGLRKAVGKAFGKLRGLFERTYKALNRGLEKTTGTPAAQGGITIERKVKDTAPKGPKRGLKVTKETVEARTKRVIKAQVEAKESTIPTNPIREQTKEFFTNAGEQVRKLIQPISTRLAKIHPKLGAMIKAAEGFSSQRVKQQSNSAIPFLKELGKLNDNDMFQLKAGLLNPRDRETLADPIFKKHPALKKSFDKVQGEVFNVNEKELDSLGLMPVKIEDWFPRVAKDPKAIYNALKKAGKTSLVSNIDKALLKQQKLVESKGGTFSEQDAMSVIAKQVHSGQFNQIPNAGSTKFRQLDHIPANILQHYGSLEESVMTHIYEMNEMIFARRLTGATGRQALLHKLRKLNKRFENAKTSGKKARIKEQYDAIRDKVEDIDTDMQQSLAATLQRIGVDPDLQDEATKLIRARVTQRGMHGSALTLKNIGLGLTIGNPLSAITQLGDQAQNIFRHQGDALGGMARALSTNDLTNRFDLDAPLREFGQETGSAKRLDKLLQWSGLKTFDMFGKESFLQASKAKFSKMSPETFEKHFENFSDFIQGDLRAAHATMKGDNLSTDALTLLFAELSDAQPVSPSETSEAFLGAGNARMFWMLKQFALKQMDSIVRETSKGFKKGGHLGAARKFIGLVGMLGLAGAGTDEIKNIILGREGEGLTDSVLSNLMQLFFINRFSLEQGVTSGRFVEDYLAGILVPPIARQAGTVVSDIITTLNEGEVSVKSLASVPLVGRITFDRLTSQGRDAELKRQKKQIAKDIREEGDSLSNIRKRINRFNKRARKAPDIDLISLGSIQRIRKEERRKQREE